MAALNNPFTPGFGQVPPFMSGRRYVIESIEDPFVNGPGDPNLTTIFTGARGTGKTTLLTLLADETEERGWVTARVSSVPGMLEDILQQAARSGSHLLSREQKPRINSIGIGGVASLGWEYNDRDNPGKNWRSRITSLLDELESHDVGLVITIDELQSDFDEMVQLASVYQHLITEGGKISLLVAGYPTRCRACSTTSRYPFSEELLAIILRAFPTVTSASHSKRPSRREASRSPTRHCLPRQAQSMASPS